jgi:hypothetical protein
MKSAYQASKRAEAIAKAAVNNLEPRMLALPTPNEVAPQGGTLGELVEWGATVSKSVNPMAVLPGIRAHFDKQLGTAIEELDSARIAGNKLIALADFIEGKGAMPADIDPELAVAGRVIKEAARTGAVDAADAASKLRRDAYVGLSEVERLKSDMVPRWRAVANVIIAKKGADYLQRCASGQAGKRKTLTLKHATSMARIAEIRQTEYRKTYSRG